MKEEKDIKNNKEEIDFDELSKQMIKLGSEVFEIRNTDLEEEEKIRQMKKINQEMSVLLKVQKDLIKRKKAEYKKNRK